MDQTSYKEFVSTNNVSDQLQSILKEWGVDSFNTLNGMIQNAESFKQQLSTKRLQREFAKFKKQTEIFFKKQKKMKRKLNKIQQDNDASTVAVIKKPADDVDEKKAYKKVLVKANISKPVCDAKYAVRGAIVQKANAIKADLAKNPSNYSFDKIIFCNIGNPQAFCPPPITFHRQVLACVMYPPIMNYPFPKDVTDRAKKLLGCTKNQSIGAYTNSRGMQGIRESVAAAIEARDGYPSSADNIMLTDGASGGIKYILQTLCSNKSEGILVPIPQYPLYTATITLLNGLVVPYYLDEDKDWSANLKSIETAVLNARKDNVTVKGIVVINPGNPTGQCINKTCIDGVIALAYKYNFAILADEVYQENIYYKSKYPFISFKKCLMSSGNNDYINNVELISFHSVSKGIWGECGMRGGYMEMVNIDQSGSDMIVKLASICLCPNTIGQCMVELMVNPPVSGDPSFDLFDKEWKQQYASLQERAKIISIELNKINGISCNTVFGAMYAFPQIMFDDIVIKNIRDKHADKTVDFVYCIELLESKGICVVPGSGFRQRANTHHFRTTILPPKDQITTVVKSIGEFHAAFTAKYS